MKNDYEVREDITAIFIKSPKYGVLETLIDTIDFDKANNFPNTWYVKYDPAIDGFYVQGNMPRKEGKKVIRFHRFLMDFPIGMVDHKNHDTLDNRRSCNLRLATGSENQQNYLKANKNSKSGILGVSWYKNSGKWQAQMKLNKKKINLGYFETIEEAEFVVKEARKTYLPFSQEYIQEKGM